MTKKPARYLFVGGWNTLFGYFLTIYLYHLLSGSLHIIVIAIIINISSITMSFSTYKLFVFKTQGNWLKEYMKSYIVYGVAALISIIGLWLLVDFLEINIWLAQAIVMVAIVIVSYIGHNLYTFSQTTSSYETQGLRSSTHEKN